MNLFERLHHSLIFSPAPGEHGDISGESFEEIQIKNFRVAALAIFLMVGLEAFHNLFASHTGAKRGELQQHELSIPVREVTQVCAEQLEPAQACGVAPRRVNGSGHDE